MLKLNSELLETVGAVAVKLLNQLFRVDSLNNSSLTTQHKSSEHRINETKQKRTPNNGSEELKNKN